MPIHSINIPTSSEHNKSSSHISSNNHNDISHDLINEIKSIESNTISIEKTSHNSSPENNLINKVKSLFLSPPPKQPAIDTELNQILSQGKSLSDESENMQSLLNEKNKKTRPSSLSLTTKTGIALGGMLLTGAIAGSGFYYLQRTNRTSYQNTNNSHSPPSQMVDNYTTSVPFNAYHPDYLHNNVSLTLESNLIGDKEIHSPAKKYPRQIPWFLNYKIKSTDIIKKSPSCPPINGKQKTKHTEKTYSYTKNQNAVCLTDSIKQRCQKAHLQARKKRGCHFIPSKMVLKIKSVCCLCPPPDWLELKVVEPPLSRILSIPHKITSVTSPRPSTPTQTVKILTYENNDEMVKNRIYDSNAYIVPPKKIITNLPTKNTSIPTNNNNFQNVKKVKLITCYEERENITTSKKLRIISNTINNPISTVLNESLVVLQYNVLSQGCVNNTDIYEMSKKTESVIESLLSWLPGYNRFRFICRVVSSLLETYSDALDNRDFNMDNIDDLHTRLLGLSKDAISSITTKDINEASESDSNIKVKNIIGALEYKKNELIVNIGEQGKKIKIKKNLNHFSDKENNFFIFYDHKKNWFVEKDIKFNNHIKEMIEKSKTFFHNPNNIYFFKNSSPEIYGNAIIIRYEGNIYSLINDEPHKIDEINLIDNVFRYIIKDDDNLVPIIYKGENWDFEEISSPSASEELVSFLTYNHKIKNNLIDKSIGHQDVSPLTPGREIQFDKKFNEYLKIENQYYPIKQSQDTSYFIDGSHDFLPLQYINNKYHVVKSYLDEICCFHKEPLGTVEDLPSKEQFFLDNTVINHMERIISLPESKMRIKSVRSNYIENSRDIDGAFFFNNENYIIYKDDYIPIYSNGDNTYILGDRDYNEHNILIYKHEDSNTYYKMPINKKKWQGLIERTMHCRVKRQPMSSCVDYFETERLQYLLEKNKQDGIIIEDYQNKLEQHDHFRSIYRKKDDANTLYYRSKDNIFFYVKQNTKKTSSPIPATFILYGKNSNQQIDLENVMTSISVIKDYDSKKIIFSTPKEAQENVFDINKKLSEMYLQWQENDNPHKEFTLANLNEIKDKISSLNDLSVLDELFKRSGKKIITSIEYIDKRLKKITEDMLSINQIKNYNINSLHALEEEKTHPVIEDICNSAFKKTINHIDDAIKNIESSKEELNSYINDVLEISDPRAKDNFITSLKIKLERMKMIFDEKHKENIIIISKKKPEEQHVEQLSNDKDTILGFTILNDPLDRIFINTAMIADFPSEGSNPKIFPQPDTPIRNRLFFINLIADTMLHEAVHALGSPEDYLYLNVNEKGQIDDIRASIKKIEIAISRGKMSEMAFEYLSKLYFMSNPLYKNFSIESINNPKIMREIFRADSFFRAIVLLNNPDTISLLIRELANFKQLDIADSPKVAVKEPAAIPTNE